jgi:anti-anti-sigma regulatory factor
MSSSRSLPPEFTIYSLANLHKSLTAALPKAARGRRASAKATGSWPIDGSAVTDVDAAAVQMLVSLSHALTVRHRTLAVTNPSGPLVRACETLGVPFLVAGAARPGSAT